MHRSLGKALIQIPSSKAMDVIGKMMIGGFLVLPFSICIRKAAIILFAKLNGVSLDDDTVMKRHPKVELPYKFLTNFITGTLCCSFVPWVFNKLNMW